MSVLDTIKLEQEEAIAILRKAFPGEHEDHTLANMASSLRTDRYKRGRYLTPDELQARPWPQGLMLFGTQ